MAAIMASTPAASLSTQQRKAPTQPAPRPHIPQTRAPTVHTIDRARRELADARIASRVEDALRADTAIRAIARHVHVAVTDGIVRLFGAVRGHETPETVETAIRPAARGATVVNHIGIRGARWGD